jgi:hypothetical protein
MRWNHEVVFKMFFRHFKSPNFFALLILSLAMGTCAFADSTVSIPLRNKSYAANDLVFCGQVLQPDQAMSLADGEKLNIPCGQIKEKLDLSRLEPAPSDVWKTMSLDTVSTSEKGAALDAALPIRSGTDVNFSGVVGNVSGRLKFNVEVPSGSGETQSLNTVSITLSTTLHTLLLRKEMLRKLGYQIPAMKYLPKLTLHFPDADARDHFLVCDIPDATSGAASRWDLAYVPADKGKGFQCNPLPNAPKPAATPVPTAQELTVVLQDVMATEATPLFYNVALAPPNVSVPGSDQRQALAQRILRALPLVYGIDDVTESLNLMFWTVGRISNEAITLTVPVNGVFSTSYDDAVWLARKIALLTEADFDDMVNRAYFPQDLKELVSAKIRSRRNSLLALFPEKFDPLYFDQNVNVGESVQKNRVLKKVWPGYATRFAGDLQSTPLEHIRYYALSELASNVLENLLYKANSEIPSLNLQNQTSKHYQDLYQSAERLYETGQPQQTVLKAWTAPILDGFVDISRNVVFGNYLGTNNLIQLVDSFGVHSDLGMMVGFDNLPTETSAQGLAEATVTINFTHIKPITDLKLAVKEPVKNLLVPWLMNRVKTILNETSSLKEEDAGATQAKLKTDLANDLAKLRDFIGIHESLIITESLGGLEQLTVSESLPTSLSPSASVVGAANQLLISRIQLYRKDENTITVYKDNGSLGELSFTFSLSAGSVAVFPILSVNRHGMKGHATSRIFSVNIDPSPSNSGIYQAARGLAQAVHSGSVELLDASQKHATLDEKFRDSGSETEFFQFVNRSLKTNSQLHVHLLDGTDANLISITDGKQRGKHYQLLATEAANYLLQLITQNTDLAVSSAPASNPGQSLLGSSHTRDAQFEGRFQFAQIPSKDGAEDDTQIDTIPDGAKLTDPYVAIQYRWEGWNITDDKIVKLVSDLKTKFGYTVYPDHFLSDTKAIKLYNVSLWLNVYEPGLRKLMTMSEDDEQALDAKYRAAHHCFLDVSKPECAALRRFRAGFSKYRNRDEADAVAEAKIMFQIATNLEQFASIDDFIAAVGGVKQIYINSSISGFETKAERARIDISSNTLGTKPRERPQGILQDVQNALGIESGEFQLKWVRDTL